MDYNFLFKIAIFSLATWCKLCIVFSAKLLQHKQIIECT